MQDIKADQRFLPDRVRAQKSPPGQIAERRHLQRRRDMHRRQKRVDMVGDPVGFPRDARADRDGPERKLIPGQQVTRKAQHQSQHHQNDADDPVELARRFVRAGVKDPAHMEKDHRDHGVRRPKVHPAQNPAERHRRVQVQHPVVRLLGGRHIHEHQQQAGHGQKRKKIQ